jgi:isoamylase
MLDDDFLVLVNAWWEPLAFTVPAARAGQTWHTDIDSFDPASAGAAAPCRAGDQVTVGPRSVLVLRGPRA